LKKILKLRQRLRQAQALLMARLAALVVALVAQAERLHLLQDRFRKEKEGKEN
jgi:hypothetical protein